MQLKPSFPAMSLFLVVCATRRYVYIAKMRISIMPKKA